jgi:hypothetical protein
MSCRDAEGGEGGDGNGCRIRVSATTPRVMQGSREEYQTEQCHADTLEDTQRARLEVQHELRVQRVSEQGCAHGKTREIGQAAVGHARGRERRD